MRHRDGREGRTPAGQYAAYQAQAGQFAEGQQGRPYTFGGQPDGLPDDDYFTQPQPIAGWPPPGRRAQQQPWPAQPGDPRYQIRYRQAPPEPEPARKGAPAPATGATIRLTLCVAVLGAVAVLVPSSRLAISVFLAIVAIWALWSRQHWHKRGQQEQPGDSWDVLAERAGFGPRR